MVTVSSNACGQPMSADAGSGSQCTDISGTWSISGNCGSFSCTITQNGCSTNFSCANGAASYTGTINGNNVTYSGSQGSCQGTISGTTISGNCTQQGSSCSYTANKQ
jgi:hypothetical protein